MITQFTARNVTTVLARPLTQDCMQNLGRQRLFSGWVLAVITALTFGVDLVALICPTVANQDTARMDQSSKKEVLVFSISKSTKMVKWKPRPGLERMMGQPMTSKSSILRKHSHGSGTATVMAQKVWQKTTFILTLTTLCHLFEAE